MRTPPQLKPLPKGDAIVSWLLFVASFFVLLGTESSVGFVRDESVYFAAAESYGRWFQYLLHEPSVALSDAAIVRFFDINHEHPVLMKMLFGLSHQLFHERLGWLRPAAAFRVPAFAAAALIPALIYSLGRSLYGKKAALFAALSFFLVPRQFFNAHLACFDVPIAALWLLTVYTFWRAQYQTRYALWCALSLGLALATKHNGWFLPFVLAPIAVFKAWQVTKNSPEGRRWSLLLVGLYLVTGLLFAALWFILGPDRFRLQFSSLSPHTALSACLVVGSILLLLKLWKANPAAFRAMAPMVGMATIGPLLFYVLWPYLWHHPIDRAAAYFAYHSRHEHYAWFYLGRLLREPPFPLEYVVVKTALTVPITLFVPMVLGLASLGVRFVKGPRWDDALIALNALVPIAIISHPDVPHFGGVKHWFPSMPFLALLGGHSVVRASQFLSQELRARWPSVSEWSASIPVSTLLLLPPLIGTARIHPYGTSYYSELAGGLPGAATLGMQRQFWSNNVTGVLPWINEHAPPNARLWLHEVTWLAFRQYQQNGMLRSDIQPAGGPQEADVAAYQYHQEFREQEFNIWQAFGTVAPVAGLYLDETPQVVVYQRR